MVFNSTVATRDFDLPENICKLIDPICEEGLSALTSDSANALFGHIEWIKNGNYVRPDADPQDRRSGMDLFYRRREETAAAARVAFEVAFGDVYNEDKAKAMIRRVLEAYVYHRGKKQRRELGIVQLFLETWHAELEAHLDRT